MALLASADASFWSITGPDSLLRTNHIRCLQLKYVHLCNEHECERAYLFMYVWRVYSDRHVSPCVYI